MKVDLALACFNVIFNIFLFEFPIYLCRLY